MERSSHENAFEWGFEQAGALEWHSIFHNPMDPIETLTIPPTNYGAFVLDVLQRTSTRPAILSTDSFRRSAASSTSDPIPPAAMDNKSSPDTPCLQPSNKENSKFKLVNPKESGLSAPQATSPADNNNDSGVYDTEATRTNTSRRGEGTGTEPIFLASSRSTVVAGSGSPSALKTTPLVTPRGPTQAGMNSSTTTIPTTTSRPSQTLDQLAIRQLLSLASSYLVTDTVTQPHISVGISSWATGFNRLVEIILALHARGSLEFETLNTASRACSECWSVAMAWRGLDECLDVIKRVAIRLKPLLDTNGRDYKGRPIYAPH